MCIRDSRPIAQLKGVSGVLEICTGEFVKVETVACGEHEVIESPHLCKKAFDMVSKVLRDARRAPGHEGFVPTSLQLQENRPPKTAA